MQRDPVEQFNDVGITPTYGLAIGTGNQGLTNTQLPGASATDVAAANTLLSTLYGYVSTAAQTFNVTSRTSGYVKGANLLRHDTYNNYAIYGQDSWKMLRRLTLTLAVRWDYLPPGDHRTGLA